MAKTGRPKKDDAPYAVEQRLKAGERIVGFRRERGWTQELLAEKVGKSALTIGRYERGEIGIKETTARWLEQETGVFWKYWTGETECQSREKYLQQENEQHERAQWMALEEYAREREEHIARLEALFFLCGYRYKIDEAAVFADLDSNREDSEILPCRHQLTPYQDPKQKYHFNDEELEALIADLRDAIGYHWYKKVEAHKRKTLKK